MGADERGKGIPRLKRIAETRLREVSRLYRSVPPTSELVNHQRNKMMARIGSDTAKTRLESGSPYIGKQTLFDKHWRPAVMGDLLIGICPTQQVAVSPRPT